MKLELNERIRAFSDIINRTTVTNSLHQEYALQNGITEIQELLLNSHKNQGITYIIGNGGSAAIASHAVIDLLNMGKLRATTLHDSAALTCISNDYGYEYVYEKQLKNLMRKDDVLVAISSSGQSKNILNAVNAAKANMAKVITLSGFSTSNPLRKSGDINLWLDSDDYGFVEIGHAFVLHNITDTLITNEDSR